jgi:Rad3-related DNA helicase
VQLTLPIRQLVEFLLKTGSIDHRFTGFDRALEGSRIHRRLQRQAVRVHPDYQAEVALRHEVSVEDFQCTLEGRADGIFTAEDGIVTIEEIKTTAAPLDAIGEDFAPEHWAQGKLYAAIYTAQHSLSCARVLLTYDQVDEDVLRSFQRDFTAQDLQDFLYGLLRQYAPWARRAAEWKEQRCADLEALSFPFAAYRPGQRAMISEVYRICREGGQLLCQAPTGIGKTMSVLFPALKSLSDRPDGVIFYLTARSTTRTAAENALAILAQKNSALHLRSITLTAKDKICLCEGKECTPDACPYANGYYGRIRDAIWDALAESSFDAQTLVRYAQKHTVCPFEFGLDLSLWCDVVLGDYNYLFDPVVNLRRFFETKGEYLFLVDEAHNLPDRAREMHSASLCKSAFLDAKKRLDVPKSALKTALGRVNDFMLGWRRTCEKMPTKTRFLTGRDEAFEKLLVHVCEKLEEWLDLHREPDETHAALLQLFFDVRGWLRVAETFDAHFVLQLSAFGSELRAAQLCLDPSAFLQQNFALGCAAVLFSATLSPAGYYRDLCGIPDARAVALKSPFPPQNLGLWCLDQVSTRYRDRESSLDHVVSALHTMASAHPGNYLAFFPSYAYLGQARDRFIQLYSDLEPVCQESAMDEADREKFLALFSAPHETSFLAFGVLGGVFGESIDLAGDKLIGVAIVGPGLPQVNPRQEQLRDYFEKTRGQGFDYAYRYPGMNKVLQAAGRVIRTPKDRGVVLLIDDRFCHADYRRIMPPYWAQITAVEQAEDLTAQLKIFWNCTSDTT